MSDELDPRQTLEQRGYLFLPELFSETEIGVLRDAVIGVWEGFDKPALKTSDDLRLDEGVQVSAPGLRIMGILARTPEVAELVSSEALMSKVTAILGENPRLELAAGFLVDGDRSYFGWEHHLGGIDMDDYKKLEEPPAPEQLDRIVVFAYAGPVGDAAGRVEVRPRAVGTPVGFASRLVGRPVGDLDTDDTVPDVATEEEKAGTHDQGGEDAAEAGAAEAAPSAEATEAETAEARAPEAPAPEPADAPAPEALPPGFTAEPPPGVSLAAEPVDVAGPAGSVLILDEATWYREAERSGAEPRASLALIFRRAGAATPKNSDPSLAEAAAKAPSLAPLVG